MDAQPRKATRREKLKHRLAIEAGQYRETHYDVLDWIEELERRIRRLEVDNTKLVFQEDHKPV